MNYTTRIEELSLNYLNTVPKESRKAIGQFFTGAEAALFMGGMINAGKGHVKILDPGAGAGILTGAAVDQLIKNKELKTISVDLYETDERITGLLSSNMNYLRESLKEVAIDFQFNIISENFILFNESVWNDEGERKYDIVISNPPYKKISKEAPEAKVMSSIVYGQPNIYFLFMAMALKMLKLGGEFIFIVPRSFTSGLYFTAFRRWFLENAAIEKLHLFVSRDASFKSAEVLQETMIVKAIKGEKDSESIEITECATFDMEDIYSFRVPYDTCVKRDQNFFIYLPTKEEDIEILSRVHQFDDTLESLGFRLKTGVVVDFRSTEFLTDNPDGAVPLLWSYNFNGKGLNFPCRSEGKPQYILNNAESKNLLMPLKNYVLLKRFTSKEESRRLQPVVFEKEKFTDYPYISTENHLNYVTKTRGDASKEELYGLYTLFKSNLYDKYFRILNGSTQVNANEINSIPFPNIQTLINIGSAAIKETDLNSNRCDQIISNNI